MSIKIHQENSALFSSLMIQGHRGEVVICPLCNKNIGHQDWFNLDSIKEIILKSSHNKSNTAIVISECPECFELSWIHKKLSELAKELSQNGLESLSMQVNEEIRSRKEKIKNIWQDSVCRNCQLLISVDTGVTPTGRECQYGRGRVLTKCVKYKPRK